MTASGAAVELDRLDQELAGIDQLETMLPRRPSLARRAFGAVWPKVAAIAIGVLLWQLIVWSGWKPNYLLAGPAEVWRALVRDHHTLLEATANTLRSALQGYLIALVIGTVVAVAITRVSVLRTAVSPLLTGLQTMPSVSWVPLALVLFGLHNSTVLFVTVIGSAPALAIGAIAGIDAVPPTLLRAGQVLGARGWRRYYHVVLPAALPGYVTGMKQGWAFAWRSVMAAELIAQIQGHPNLGGLQAHYQDQTLASDLEAVMVIILVVGLLLDSLVFSQLERVVLSRRGLRTAT